jgi:DNA polymerase I
MNCWHSARRRSSRMRCSWPSTPLRNWVAISNWDGSFLCTCSAEFRVATNGLYLPNGNGLVGALIAHGLYLDAGEKKAMTTLINSKADYTSEERAAITTYCETDVRALIALLPRMAAEIDWPRAMLRGRYMSAVARMERVGVPIDAGTHRALVYHWDEIKRRLVEAVDPQYRVFDGLTFKKALFEDYLARHGIPWPRLPSGALDLEDVTFRDQCLSWPQRRPLHELRTTLSGLRLTGLEVGSDARNRCLLSPFSSITGRNQPSSNKFIFGPSRWLRALIKPPEGKGIAYLDFVSQEIAVQAGLSGDPKLIACYEAGDPYRAFARLAGLLPSNADAMTTLLIRNRCKALFLGIGYGMQAETLAFRAGISECDARDLLRLHRETYKVFWAWSEATVTAGLLSLTMQGVFGWRRHVTGDQSVKPRKGRMPSYGPNERSLQNWPVQSAAAEMLRVACIAGTEAGIAICCPVHDALMIEADLAACRT